MALSVWQLKTPRIFEYILVHWSFSALTLRYVASQKICGAFSPGHLKYSLRTATRYPWKQTTNMLSKSLLLACAALLAVTSTAEPMLRSTTLAPRHHEDESEHSHDQGEEEEGQDHGDHGDHGMNFGDFGFTETDIMWPGCVQDCVHDYLDFLEPVDHPLCVNEDFYANVTSCVAEDCSEYEQGAYTVVMEIECPEEEDFSARAVSESLAENGGAPQECHSMESEVMCDNGTESGMGAEDTGMNSVPLGRQTLVLGAVLTTIPLALFF